jgi:choline kinase
MKAIILSAGQGHRLLPLTRNMPKCLLPVQGDRSILDYQLHTLAQSGVEEVLVAVGFGAAAVQERLNGCSIGDLKVRTLFNPFYAHSDNLVTAWLARAEFDGDFLLLNGDTLFGPGLLDRVLAAPPSPISISIHQKPTYDDDDMKVSLSSNGCVSRIAKTIAPNETDAESIGLIRFQQNGAERFVAALESAIRHESALRDWYLSAINQIAERSPIDAVDITGHWWDEVDSITDLERARTNLSDCENRPKAQACASAPQPVATRRAS